MGTTIILKSGKREVIANDRHFEDLLRENLGNDAAQVFHDRLSALKEASENFCSDIKSIVTETKTLSHLRTELTEVIDDFQRSQQEMEQW